MTVANPAKHFAPDRVAIIGGGPGGYEAAMVAADAGAEVTIIEDQGMGGSAVLTDVVPSKTLIATAGNNVGSVNRHRRCDAPGQRLNGLRSALR